MKIIILGAGQVGSTVAEHLAAEPRNDITVVDRDAELLHDLQEHLDIRTVAGEASYPTTLEAAGADDADMILAVTSSDEANMVACQIAWTLFRTPTKIARLRSQEYQGNDRLFGNNAVPIDTVISPEMLVRNHVQRLIEYPGALQVLDFADGRVQLVAVRAYHGGPMVGHQLRELKDQMPKVDARVAAIFRRGRAIFPEGDTTVEAGDEVFFVAARENIRRVMGGLRRLDKPYRYVMIAGGGNIGQALARSLEGRCRVKLIERNRRHARQLAETLDRTLVLQGDVADEDLLLEENIDEMDVFCAVTNDDEANILSSMLAKRLGARKVMSIINRTAYVDLVESGAVDVAISPQQITIGALLTHVRRGDVVSVHSLRRGAAEAIEAVAHGDRDTSRVVGRAIRDIALPRGTNIGAIVRAGRVVIPHGETVIEPEDHVILFLVDKRRVREVEQLFEVAVTFV